jgi:hypothetical protein
MVTSAAALLVGALLLHQALLSVVRTLVMPRGERDRLTAGVFRLARRLFELQLRGAEEYRARDRVMAPFAPAGFFALALVWGAIVGVGYTLLFWAVGLRPWTVALTASGSCLLTLGFVHLETLPQLLLGFSEATVGLGLVALVIAYLPTMYSAFSRRETAVALLEVYAGEPPSAISMIARVNRIRGLDYLNELWTDWERWFAEIEESHTSLAALAYFRSPRPERSWITAAGTILDAASLEAAAIDRPSDPRGALCIRAGYLCLRSIADYFDIPYDSDPLPTDPISIERAEFDAALDELAREGVPLRADRDQAWRDFAGWRVNYDTVLLALASMTVAPPAAWSSDRSTLRRV